MYCQPQQILLFPSTHATYFGEHVLTGLIKFVVVDRMHLIIVIHVQEGRMKQKFINNENNALYYVIKEFVLI